MVKLIRIPVSDDNQRLLKVLAAKDGVSLAEYLRRCIQQALEVSAPDYVIDMSAGLGSWGGNRSKDDE